MRRSRPKVLFITTSNGGTAFYRQYQFKECMNKSGLASAVMPWYHAKLETANPWQWDNPHNPASTAYSLYKHLASKADVVVVQYLHTMEALVLIECLKQALFDTGKNIPFLTEIDDYIHETPVDFECFKDYKPGNKYRKVVEEQIKSLDGVIVSTPYLKEVYEELNSNVYIVPNAIDFSTWDKIDKFHAKKEVRVGWAGGGNHDADLETIETPIKNYLKDSPNVFFHMVHGIPNSFKEQSKIVCHKFYVPPTKWPRRLCKIGFDIGLAPLQCNDFKRAKSNLRRLEIAAMEVPVLATKWGELERTIEHGKDGFLYENEVEFSKYLDILVKNKELRINMGRYNYLTAKRDFSLPKMTEHYVEVLKEVVAKGQTTKINMDTEKTWTARQPVLS